MAWEKTCSLKDFEKQSLLRVNVNNQPILLVYDQGHVFAIDDRCPHLGASLAKGSYQNGVIECPKHHAQIDVKTGEIQEKAKIIFIKMPTKKAKTFKTKIEKEVVFVEV